MCSSKYMSFDVLRKTVKICTLLELMILSVKAATEVGGHAYITYNCENATHYLDGSSFCQRIQSLIDRHFTLSVIDRDVAFGGILLLDLGFFVTAMIKYFGVTNDNSSQGQLSFRLGIFLWFLGLFFWLYLAHRSYVLIFSIISVHVIQYFLLLLLRKYLIQLIHCKAGNAFKNLESNEEVTKL